MLRTKKNFKLDIYYHFLVQIWRFVQLVTIRAWYRNLCNLCNL